MTVDPLAPAALRRRCDPAGLGFQTTADLEPVEGIVGQDRAVEAVEFAIGMRRDGYNVFVEGPEGSGRTTLLRGALGRAAAGDPAPDDLCYVHRFPEPTRPRALRLPAGRGAALREAMERLIAELRAAIPAAFESEAYRGRKEALERAIRERRERALEEFETRARKADVALIRTPMGIGLAMVKGEAVLEPEEFKALPPDEQAGRRSRLQSLESELELLLRHLPSWEREGREQLAALDREVIRSTAEPIVAEVRAAFADLPDVVAHLADVESDVISRAQEFVAAATGPEAPGPGPLRALAVEEAASLRRYRVNLLVDHGGSAGAPVVYETNPTYGNLLGRIEHLSQLGALMTDFTLIRPGALHRANDGYLVLDARKVLVEPYAWEGLKRALRNGEIRVEPPGRALALIDTLSLEPDPVALRVKVALIGERQLCDLLTELDPEFPELFKVSADFDDRLVRTPETDGIYARLVAAMIRREGLRAFDAGAVARLIDHSARESGDAERLSTHMRSLDDLLQEADHVASVGGRDIVTAADVGAAIDARRRRSGRRRELSLEAVTTGVLLVETTGEVVGQVNGLSVHQLGDEVFGWPTRITARARLGEGEVVDIEREVELGGPIHSKGVLILFGYLAGRYASDRPLSLHASLVFEQSYGGVEGDSASLAELCVLLSAIGGVPIRQSLAMTGSVDQHGLVQAIGGVNEKIEGFFEVCESRGLTGEQGVVIPASNVRHLMLRPEVVAATEAGRFRVWPVRTVDEALELLTGVPAGERDETGAWTPGSVHARVEARLRELAAAARKAATPPGAGGDRGGGAGGDRRREKRRTTRG
jgi:predicted ATP-dependent protease